MIYYCAHIAIIIFSFVFKLFWDWCNDTSTKRKIEKQKKEIEQLQKEIEKKELYYSLAIAALLELEEQE